MSLYPRSQGKCTLTVCYIGSQPCTQILDQGSYAYKRQTHQLTELNMQWSKFSKFNRNWELKQNLGLLFFSIDNTSKFWHFSYLIDTCFRRKRQFLVLMKNILISLFQCQSFWACVMMGYSSFLLPSYPFFLGRAFSQKKFVCHFYWYFASYFLLTI